MLHSSYGRVKVCIQIRLVSFRIGNLFNRSVCICIFRNFSEIAVATSDKQIHVYKWRQSDLMDQIILADVPDLPCGVRFANNDPNILFASSASSISMFDLRTQEKVAKFTGKTFSIFHIQRYMLNEIDILYKMIVRVRRPLRLFCAWI